MDRGVEAEPLLGAAQRLAAAVLEPRILDHDVRKRRDHRAVELGVGHEVDRSTPVVGLQVEHAHAIGGGEPRHQCAVPVLVHVELELELRVEREVRLDLGARRDDEAHRPVRAPDEVGE